MAKRRLPIGIQTDKIAGTLSLMAGSLPSKV